MRGSKSYLPGLAFLLACSFVRAGHAAPNNIGVTAAAKSSVSGILGDKTSALSVGSDVFQNEIVQTGPGAMAQLLFLDQTSLSIGPKSQVKLDQFVYDDKGGHGQVVLEASKGAFRFITGAQDPRSYSLKTPVAIIGVRGTIVDFFVDGDKLIMLLDDGHAFVTMDDGKVVEISTPGDALIVNSDKTFSGPAPWSGSIQNTIHGTSFPLYGNRFTSTPEDNDSGSSTDQSNLTDELASHFVNSVSSEPPPPPLPMPPSSDNGGVIGNGDGGGQ